MSESFGPYSPPKIPEAPAKEKSAGCFIASYLLLGLFIALLGISAWLAILIDFSKIGTRSGGASIGFGVAMISLSLFVIGGTGTGVLVFFIFNKRQSGVKRHYETTNASTVEKRP